MLSAWLTEASCGANQVTAKARASGRFNFKKRTEALYSLVVGQELKLRTCLHCPGVKTIEHCKGVDAPKEFPEVRR